MRPLIYILCFLSFLFGSAQNKGLFQQGKEQYKAEKYQEALNSWNKILESGAHSSALYFNMANAHYRLNQIGPSIYFYEKGLQLSPGDSEILNNLAFAENATVDAIEPLPKTFFAKWDETLSGWLTFNGWAWVTVFCALLFTALFLLYYFSIRSLQKRLLFVSAVLSLIVLLGAFTMSFRIYNQQQIDRPAIIFAESTDVKSDPTMKSETSFTLHEGTKVQILATDEDWSRILIADGKDGWIPSEDLKAL
ncbi:MAG: SH3 domain-containing protein [Bacteroidota bacterium]